MRKQRGVRGKLRPTGRHLGTANCLIVWCSTCGYRESLSAEDLVASGKGDLPLIELRFRCRNCHSPFTDQIVGTWTKAAQMAAD